MKSMSRLIVVSNRVSLPRETRAGGLALALNSALGERGGLRFGWSGKFGDEAYTEVRHVQAGGIDYALIDLSAEDYATYYQGYANSSLWPLLHFRADKIAFNEIDREGYHRVNRRFARHLAGLVEDEDILWIHDYHLIPLAHELRALGVKARLGFFLHVPLPPPEMLATLPGHRELFGTLADYELVGVQTDQDLHALRSYFEREYRARSMTSGMLRLEGGRQFVARTFPIGIDAQRVARNAELAMSNKYHRRFVDSLQQRALVVSVDRLDYSKGLTDRFRAFGRFLDLHPEHHNRVSMMQIAPVSRGDVAEYRDLRERLEGLAGAVNGRHAEPDWNPIRYINRSFHQATLAGFYRAARVGLVTPLRDGMNLVAKEYVAAQSPEDPGVLVLSQFAGAACQLPEALLINPLDHDATAEAIHLALSMPLDERRQRWSTMNDRVHRSSITAWRESFIEALCAQKRQFDMVA
jgi:trehalose 6-phosphate synthase